MVERIENYLDELFPDPRCELNYNKDYELLIATMLSAQTTDKRVNMVTSVLFDKYDTLEKLVNADIKDLESIIRSVGSFRKKAQYIKGISKELIEKFDGIVPNNRDILTTLPGVGRKTANVVLSNIYNYPAIAVDTHVERVSKRLGMAFNKDNVEKVEMKLMKKIKKEKWSRVHHQMVLFGRYHCRAISPDCSNCKISDICKYYKKNNKGV